MEIRGEAYGQANFVGWAMSILTGAAVLVWLTRKVLK